MMDSLKKKLPEKRCKYGVEPKTTGSETGTLNTFETGTDIATFFNNRFC